MKRNVLLIFVLILSLVLSFTLFSCGEEPCTEHKDENTDGKCDVCGEAVETSTPNTLDLIKDGKACFNIVIRSGSAANVTMKVNEEIVKVLSDLGIEVKLVEDKAETVTDCELLIGGAVSRGEKYDVDQHYLGSKGYAVKLVDSKVLILAGSQNTLGDAIKHFMKEVLGISGQTKELTNVTMTEDMSLEQKQTGYSVTSVSVAGNPLSDYSIAVITQDSAARAAATSIQGILYTNTGIWLEIVTLDTNPTRAIVIKTVESACEDGFSVTEKDGSIYIECEFPEKFSSAAEVFIRSAITAKKGDVKLDAGYSYTANVRCVYYSEFGAKGDGKTDDFYAIKKAHDYANAHGNTVCADFGKTYYIGNAAIENMTAGRPSESRSEYITVMTDVIWDGASFIFDDSTIPVEYWYKKHLYNGADVLYGDVADENAKCSRCHKLIHEDKGGCNYRSSGWHTMPIFFIKSENKSTVLTDTSNQDKTDNVEWEKLNKGDTSIKLKGGEVWKPEKPVIVVLKNSNVRHYIRTGTNVDNGQIQQEIILVNADGTIDESTPLHWDYDVITYFEAKPTDDKPITVSGKCTITTVANQGPNYYYAYGRNIRVERSNVTVSGITHLIDGEDKVNHKCPQNGFTYTRLATNVTFKDMVFTHQKGHKDASNGSSLGTYEISIYYSNNVKFESCTQTDFYKRFKTDGTGVLFGGFFGSDYCKNLAITDSELESFDAHCGTYNVTLKNSTFEHINCIGEGLIYMENVTVYVGGSDSVNRNLGMIRLRTDYGSTWQGELYAKDVKIMSCVSDNEKVAVFHSEWKNHYYGYTTYLPEKVTLDNVKVVKYSYTVTGTKVNFNEQSVNAVPLYLTSSLNTYTSVDISKEGSVAPYQNDRKQCKCATFNDTDGDGRCNNNADTTSNEGNVVWCWGYETSPDVTANANPYQPTKNITVLNCEGLELRIPPTPQFAQTVVTIDGGETTIDPATGIVSKKILK